MSETVGIAGQEAQDDGKTTVGAFWDDATEIRELKRKLKLHSQQEVVRHLIEFYKKNQPGKEEAGHGVHSN